MESPAIADLESLLWPLSPDRFAADVAARVPFLHPGPLQRLRALEALLGGFEVEEIARRVGSGIVVAGPGPQGDTTREADTDEALCAYQSGSTLYFVNMPWLRDFADRIGADVGVPVEIGLFAVRAGHGTPCHFDASESFHIQLRGTKTWRVAANDHVDAPLEHWTAGKSTPTELASYAPANLPSDPLANATVFELAPASVMYLPRGYWHATDAGEDSLSLTLAFRPGTWMDLVRIVVRALLAADPEARRYAMPAWGGRVASLERVVSRLRDGLATWVSSAQVTPPPAAVAVAYRRRPLARLQLADSLARVSTFTTTEQRDCELEIPVELAPIVAWVVSQRSMFRLDDARAAHPALDTATVQDALDVLCTAEYLEVVPVGNETVAARIAGE